MLTRDRRPTNGAVFHSASISPASPPPSPHPPYSASPPSRSAAPPPSSPPPGNAPRPAARRRAREHGFGLHLLGIEAALPFLEGVAAGARPELRRVHGGPLKAPVTRAMRPVSSWSWVREACVAM